MHSRIVFLYASHLAFDQQAFSVRILRCTTHHMVHMVDRYVWRARSIPAACCYTFYYVKLVSIGECAIVITLIYLFCTVVTGVVFRFRRFIVWTERKYLRSCCMPCSTPLSVGNICAFSCSQQKPTRRVARSHAENIDWRKWSLLLPSDASQPTTLLQLTTTHRNTTISRCVYNIISMQRERQIYYWKKLSEKLVDV